MDQLAPKRQKTGLCLTHNPVFCQTAAVPDEVVIASMFGPWVVSGLDLLQSKRQIKNTGTGMICTPFTGHPVEGVLLCGTHMSTKGNV